MIKSLFVKSILLVLPLAFAFSAQAGTKIGNGGAGIVVDGNDLTFPETGLKVEGAKLTDIPELAGVMGWLQKVRFNNSDVLSLTKTLFPSWNRTYYQVSEMDPAVIAEIKKIYSAALHIPASQVVVYAITDAEQMKTFLLPEFYKLNTLQRELILFHEWLWTLNSDASYSDVLVMENLFYQLTQNPEKNYLSFTFQFSDFVKHPSIAVPVAVHWSPDLKADQVFDASFFQCVSTHLQKEIIEQSMDQNCLSDWLLRLSSSSAELNPVQKAILYDFRSGTRMSLSYRLDSDRQTTNTIQIDDRIYWPTMTISGTGDMPADLLLAFGP